MSTDLRPTRCLTGVVHMTRYYGGSDNDVCLQMTFRKPDEERGPDHGRWYIQMTREQAREMGEHLIDFANGEE